MDDEVVAAMAAAARASVGVRGIEPREIEAAIPPRTAAFAFAANPAQGVDAVSNAGR